MVDSAKFRLFPELFLFLIFFKNNRLGPTLYMSINFSQDSVASYHWTMDLSCICLVRPSDSCTDIGWLSIQWHCTGIKLALTHAFLLLMLTCTQVGSDRQDISMSMYKKLVYKLACGRPIFIPVAEEIHTCIIPWSCVITTAMYWLQRCWPKVIKGQEDDGHAPDSRWPAVAMETIIIHVYL